MNLGIGLGLTNYLRVPTVALDPDAAIAALFGSGEVGAWYDPSDSTTVFQDAAGTTPAGVGDPVGLILDKSKGLTLGAEQVVNGDFSSGSSNWSAGAYTTIAGGQADVLNCPSGTNVLNQNTVQPGANVAVKISFQILNWVSGGLTLYINNDIQYLPISSNGVYSVYIHSTLAAGSGLLIRAGGGTFTGTIDNISVRELPGNHATQTTSAARPILQQSGATPVLSGTELVTNGQDWTGASGTTPPTGWTSPLSSADSTYSVSGGVLTMTNGTGSSRTVLRKAISVTPGATYKVVVTGLSNGDSGGTGTASLRVADSDSYADTTPIYLTTASGDPATSTFIATTSTVYVFFVNLSSTNGVYVSVDDVSLQEVTSWSGGLRYLDFDGVDDSLQSSAFASAQAQPNTIAIGAQSTNITTSYFYDTDSSGDPYRHALIISTQTSVALYAGGFGYATVDAISTESVLTAYFSGTSSYLRQNGALKSTPINPGTNSWTGVTLGSRYTTNQAHLDGRIYSYVGVNRTLTAAEITDLETYLAAKSGVTL